MANVQFGAGVIYGNPRTDTGNPPTNPSPVRMGIVQECTVDFKADLKKLYGQKQFPVATARGKFDVTMKGKMALFDPTQINQLYFAQTQATGYYLIVDGEQYTLNATTQVVAHTPVVADWGVQYANGQTFIKTNGAPAIGQYNVVVATGTYGFNASDNAASVKISYTYSVNSGATISLANQLMGYAPEVTMKLYNKFRNKYLAVTFNDVTLGGISIPTKLEDFWVMDFDGSANADPNDVLGLIEMDVV